jgi:hypothetical protein
MCFPKSLELGAVHRAQPVGHLHDNVQAVGQRVADLGSRAYLVRVLKSVGRRPYIILHIDRVQVRKKTPGGSSEPPEPPVSRALTPTLSTE